MKMNKRVVALLGFLLAGLFYWFGWRPSQIKSACDQVAWDYALDNEYDQFSKTWKAWIDKDSYSWKYTQCLHSKGLK